MVEANFSCRLNQTFSLMAPLYRCHFDHLYDDMHFTEAFHLIILQSLESSKLIAARLSRLNPSH